MTCCCKLTVDKNLRPHVSAGGIYGRVKHASIMSNNSQNPGKTALRARRTTSRYDCGQLEMTKRPSFEMSSPSAKTSPPRRRSQTMSQCSPDSFLPPVSG